MKIGPNKYQCMFCMEIITHKRDSMPAASNPATKLPGRHTGTSTLKCPKCNRNVSQKTKEGFK